MAYSDFTFGTVADTSDLAAIWERTHTTASVSDLGDGFLRVRFDGPRGSGTATVLACGPFMEVLTIMHQISGRNAGDFAGTVQGYFFLPSPGSTAVTPHECHASREYDVLMYTV